MFRIFLKRILGYTNIAYKEMTIEDIRTQLRFNKTPVYACGSARYDDTSLGIEKGGPHAWVIDGWQEKTEWHGTGGGVVGDVSVKVDYVYCRYGYEDAKHDGWVKYDVLASPVLKDEIYQGINMVSYYLNK